MGKTKKLQGNSRIRKGTRTQGAGPCFAVSRTYAGTMFSACGPFWPCVMSKVTF